MIENEYIEEEVEEEVDEIIVDDFQAEGNNQ